MAELPSLRARAIAGSGGMLITSLMRTLRWEVEGADGFFEQRQSDRQACLFLLWHGRLLPLSYYHRHQGLATLISRHRDGDYISGVVERWGFTAIRGSSSRGGAGALREIVRLLRRGTSIAITPDGPRGPRQVMKSGPLRAAQLAGVPVILASAGASSAWWVGGWDRFMIPRPFSRIRVVYGEPFTVPRDADQDEIERLSRVAEARLNELTVRAEAHG